MREATLKQTQPDLSIIIPAYHEENRIGHTLDELAVFLKHDNFFKLKTVEVLVVAADSPDKTRETILAKKRQFKQLKLLQPGPKIGKGRDVQFGMQHATGSIVVFMDADMATPLIHLRKFYNACTGDSDLVIGTRNLHTYRPNLVRRLFASIGNVLFRLAGGIWIEDSQCGFKMCKQAAAKICYPKLTILGWGFDMEVLTIAKVNGLKIKHYRINDWKDVPGGTFTDNVISISLQAVKDLLHIVLNRLNGSYIQVK